ncbi:hypothetical protein [Streptomyces sp. NPDC003247]|uniref:hypothetical protein n=1 Tax=Streptomyces sp. NPDC003247 TaxID=3364677 RepID=UPI003684E2B6
MADSGARTYLTNDATVEAQLVDLPQQENLRGLRIRVNGANLTWKHYALAEIEILDN